MGKAGAAATSSPSTSSTSFGAASTYDAIKRLQGEARRAALHKFMGGGGRVQAWLALGRSIEEFANENI